MPSQSLFTPDVQPVTAGAVEWVEATLFGPFGVGICVLAVAFVGYRMLLGLLPVAMAFRTVVGTAILLGAPMLASAFMSSNEPGPISVPVTDSPAHQSDHNALAPAPDPNAGASLRRD